MAEPDLQGQLQAELDPEFQIVRLLGEGSVAQVYLARERALQRLVAVKFMKSPYAQDDTARKRFEREARSAAKIHHHNVATVHRVGSLEDQTPFIIMEYIEGRNLADELQAEGVMTTEQACHTLSQVASALVAAHEKGIVHRDVKPANVVREKDSDRVVLTDFGIAGILETGTETITRLTKYGELLGDPRYMSPEQLLGESVTDQSDVYSLGILGYELLTLKAPYEGKTSVQMVAAHLKKEPIPLTELRPDADPFLAELLERCLSKNPLHRPRASEVAKVLEQVTEEPQASGQGRESDSFTSQSFSGAFQHIPALERFVAELKRRHVFNVAVFYILVTAGLLSFADATLESLFDDPDNARDILVAVTLGGFPVILVLSWMFDISSKGIHRTQSEILGSARIKSLRLAGFGADTQPGACRAGRLVDFEFVASPVSSPAGVVPEAGPRRSPNPSTITNAWDPSSSTGMADTRRGSRSSTAMPRPLRCSDGRCQIPPAHQQTEPACAFQDESEGGIYERAPWVRGWVSVFEGTTLAVVVGRENDPE